MLRFRGEGGHEALQRGRHQVPAHRPEADRRDHLGTRVEPPQVPAQLPRVPHVHVPVLRARGHVSHAGAERGPRGVSGAGRGRVEPLHCAAARGAEVPQLEAVTRGRGEEEVVAGLGVRHAPALVLEDGVRGAGVAAGELAHHLPAELAINYMIYSASLGKQFPVISAVLSPWPG